MLSWSYVLVDRSPGQFGQCAKQHRFRYKQPSVRFGLTVFPSDADPADGFFGSLSGCVTGYDWPNISMQTRTISDFLTKRWVTPLVQPLSIAVNATISGQRENWLSGGALRWRRYLHWGDLFFPAWPPTCYYTRFREMNVKTYVIGYNYTDDPIELNAIAQNGGTSFNEYVYAGGESLLTGVFQEFLLEIKECQ